MNRKLSGFEIVKIQIDSKGDTALIYNKDNTIMYQTKNIPKEFKGKKLLKKYCYAEPREDGLLNILTKLGEVKANF